MQGVYALPLDNAVSVCHCGETATTRMTRPAGGWKAMEPQVSSAHIFTPNLVEEPSAQLLSGERVAELAPTRQESAGPAQAFMLPPNSDAVRLRITAIQIMDGLQSGFLGLSPPKGVYLLSTVVDGLGEDPIQVESNVYTRISNGQLLPLGTGDDRDAPFTVYLREGALPRILCFGLLVVRSNE